MATLVHLMDDDLLDACGEAAPGGDLELAPFTVPDAITCPTCRELIPSARQQTIDTDHAAALEARHPAS